MAQQTYSELAAQLAPYLAGQISSAVKNLQGGSGGGAFGAHDLGGTLHTGVLRDSQAPQFFLVNGTRPLTGNLVIGDGYTVDGVDISAVRLTANTSLTGGGPLATFTPLGINYNHAGLWTALQTYQASIALPTLAGGGIVYAQTTTGTLLGDASHFVWDPTNTRLGVGLSTPTQLLHVQAATGTAIGLVQAADPTGTGQALIIAQGQGIPGGAGSSNTALQLLDSAATAGQVGINVAGSAASRSMTVQAQADRDATPLPLHLATWNSTAAPVTSVTVGAGANAGFTGIGGDPLYGWAATVTGATYLNGRLALNSTFDSQHILPQMPDTYDLGSPTLPFRKGYLSEIDAMLFAENTISPIGGWLMIAPNQGTLKAAASSSDTTVDFGTGMVEGHTVIFRGLFMVEYMRVGQSTSARYYSYRVTARTAAGETLVSTAAVTIGLSLPTSSVTVTWAAVPGATGYTVYGRTYGTEATLAVLGNVLTWTDTGAVTPGALPPTVSTATLPTPVAPTATTQTTGGTLTAGAKSYKITALTRLGETDGSPGSSTVTTTGSTSSVTVTWTALQGATGYSIYGRSGGTYGLIGTVGAVTTWLDIGAGTGAVPPSVNTALLDPPQAPTVAVALSGGTLGGSQGTRYTVTRDLDGTGANDWPVGAVWVDYGAPGDGRIELNASATPRISLITHGTYYNDQTEVVRVGDLNTGWDYTTTTYGMVIGAQFASDNITGLPWLSVDPVKGIRMSNGNLQLAQLDINGTFNLGQVLQGHIVLWSSGDFGIYSNATPRIFMSAAGTLGLYNNAGTPMITLDNAGNSYFAGFMSIGTAGGIYQGTGTAASPTTGLKLFSTNVGGNYIGQIATYNAGVLQVAFNTAGSLSAGAGAWTVNAGGQIMQTGSAQANRINWMTGSALDGYAAVRRVGAANVASLFVTNPLSTSLRSGWEVSENGVDLSRGVLQLINLPALTITANGITTGTIGTAGSSEWKLGTLQTSAAPSLDVTVDGTQRFLPILTSDSGGNNNGTVYALASPITPTAYNNVTATTQTNTAINVATAFGVPAGTQAVYLRILAYWTAASNSNFMSIQTGTGGSVMAIRSLVANAVSEIVGLVAVSASNNVYLSVGGATANGVTITCTGYVL